MENVKRSYTHQQISDMKKTDLWRGCIRVRNEDIDIDTSFHLYPTGDATFDGRIFIALPVDLVITEDVQRTYNLF